MAEMDFAEMVDAKNPLAVTDPELVPSARYYDEDFFKLECDRLWPHAWQMAARLEQIPNVGDWVEYANVGKSVLVVRTADGVKAYENHCRHRGVPLAGGSNYDKGGNAHGNCAKAGFICPFHGWRWNMDGENTFVYGRQRGQARSRRAGAETSQGRGLGRLRLHQPRSRCRLVP